MTTRQEMAERLRELDDTHDEALVEHASRALSAAIEARDIFYLRHAFLALQRVRNPTRYLRAVTLGARTWGALELRGAK